jgi:maltose alpha-D-glucosyltransferase/alpha-amylase
MGEDLSLPDRDAIRTPMQWERGATAGFSDADPADLVQPVRTRGRYGSASVNVLDQQDDGDSLLSWFERLIRRLRDCPEIGVGTCTVLDVPLPRPVLAHRFDAPEGSVLFLHNLADTSVTLDLGRQDGADTVVEVFADGGYELPTLRLTGLELHGYGYRWFRLRRGRGD